MKLTSACQTISINLGAAVLLVLSAPALAGDLGNGAAGGIKDYGAGGVPVPAPAPYEENYKWYVRGDIGTAFKSSGRFGIEGLPVEVTQPGDWHEQSILSFGFGKYITPSVRTELTLDYRTPRNIASGSKSLADISKTARVADTTAGIFPAINKQTNIYSGVQNEDVNYQNSTFLMSAFYDFNHEGRFKPYIGGGVGLARHELTRAGTITYTCYDGFQTSASAGYVVPQVVSTGCTTVPGTGTPVTGGLNQQYITTTHKTATGWGVAAQLSTGLTYDLSPRTHWDTGYRMMWQSGRLGVTSSDGVSTIRVQDRTDHEVRTGVRFDVW